MKNNIRFYSLLLFGMTLGFSQESHANAFNCIKITEEDSISLNKIKYDSSSNVEKKSIFETFFSKANQKEGLYLSAALSMKESRKEAIVSGFKSLCAEMKISTESCQIGKLSVDKGPFDLGYDHRFTKLGKELSLWFHDENSELSFSIASFTIRSEEFHYSNSIGQKDIILFCKKN